MKAIRLDQPQQFARIDIPEPPAPAAGYIPAPKLCLPPRAGCGEDVGMFS